MLRLRQVAFVAADLTAAEVALTNALDVQRCYRDPNVGVFGLRNALFPVGDQFLEIVSPITANTTAGRLLEKRGGDAGYMALFQVDDLEPVERRLEAAQVRVVFDAQGEAIRGLHLHPRDVPGAIVSIDAAEIASEWPWAGPTWRDHVRASRVQALCGMEISVASPSDVCATWANVLGVSTRGNTVATDDALVTFVHPTERAGREGIVTLEFATSDASLVGTQAQVLGVELRFVGALAARNEQLATPSPTS